MAPLHSGEDQLRLVVDWFSRQQAFKIPELLEAPLRRFLAGLPAVERRRVLPTNKRKRLQCGQNTCSLKSFEREALKYLKAKQVARGGGQMDDSRILRTVNALACDHKPTISEGGFWTLLTDDSRTLAASPAVDDNDPGCSVLTPAPANIQFPLQRLLKLYQRIELSTHLHDLASRILKVLIHHQFKSLKAIGIDNEAQEKEMLRLTGITIEDSKDLRTRATGWLRFMSVFGIGALAIVQAQANDEFEKHATLAFLRDCRQFFVEKYPNLWKRMTEMNKVVGNLFLQANTKYARDERTLMEGSEALPKCLRKAFEESASETPPADSGRDAGAERHGTSPLSALATVATAAAAEDERDLPVPGSHDQAHNSRAGTPSPDRSGPGLTTNAVVARDEGATAGQVQTPVSCEGTMYGQALQPRWQSYAEQACPQQTSTHEIPLNGAGSLPPFCYDHGNMITRNCTELSASGQTASTFMATNLDGQGLQHPWRPWTDSDEARMTPGNGPEVWTTRADNFYTGTYYGGWPDNPYM